MRVLIDECIDPRVVRLFPDGVARTVHEEGWGSLEDGELLRMASGRFDVLVTLDRGLPKQQNLARFLIAVVIVSVPKNQFVCYQRIEQQILQAVSQSEPGRVIYLAAK